MIQLWLDSTVNFSGLTQLRLNSNIKFASMIQVRLNLFESKLSQIWLTTHDTLPNLTKTCCPRGGGGGLRSNVSADWFFPCYTTNKRKILTFYLQIIYWLNFDSSSFQLAQLWLKRYQRDSTLTRLISLIFTVDSTLTRLIWVRVESNLTHDSWVEHNPGRYCRRGSRGRRWGALPSLPGTEGHHSRYVLNGALLNGMEWDGMGWNGMGVRPSASPWIRVWIV